MAGWTTVEEIIAYQLSVKLRDQIVAMVDLGDMGKDFDFRDQIKDAARSAPRTFRRGSTGTSTVNSRTTSTSRRPHSAK
jgi:hypothetical protein